MNHSKQTNFKLLTGCPKSELDIKNAPSPNPLFFKKISDSALKIHNRRPFKLIRIA
jgi:hypothetical protein